MSGIDNNTVLMLHGEEIVDSSVAPKNITNNGVTVNENGKFGKGLNLGSNQYLKITNGMQGVDLAQDFTIEWWEYSTGASANNSGLFTNRIRLESAYGRGLLLGSSGTKIYMGSTENRVWDGFEGVVFKDKTDNIWVHWRLVKKGTSWTSYKNGKKFWNGINTVSPSNFEYDCCIGSWVDHELFYSRYNAIIDEFRICNYAVCDGDFEVPTRPYNSIKINILSQTATNINFSVIKLGQETINKVEVLVNGTVSETYTDSYDNINYSIDTDLCSIDNNNITIRVTFDDTYTEELSLTHNITIDELPLETPLLDTVERVKLLTKSKQNEKTMLSSILTSKNVEVTEEDKMSDLIDKVNELGDPPPPPLYLYKEGDECTDITGGIVQVSTSGNMANSTFTKLEKSFTFQVAGTRAADMTNNGFVTNNVINCTKYSKLIFKYKINNFQNPTYEFNIEHRANANKLYSGTSYSTVTHNKPHTVSSAEKEVVVDISNVNSAYMGIWFRIGGYGNLVIEVSEIRMEQ